MPSESPSPGPAAALTQRYRERAYGLLAGMAANDYLDHLSVARLVGGTDSGPFYDLFGTRDGFLAAMREDATGPDSGEALRLMLRALVESLSSLSSPDPAAAEKVKDLIEGGLRRWLEPREEVRACLRLILIAAAPVDARARDQVEAMHRRQMAELVSLLSASLDVLRRRPISQLGSVERLACTVAIVMDGALLRTRLCDPDVIVRLLRDTVIPLIAALTVPVAEAEPEPVLLSAPEELSLDAPERWERVLAPVESTVMLGARVLQRRIAELGRDISRDYGDRDPILVCVLRSAVVFFSDLIRHITVPSQHGFMRVSSYKGTQSSGQITIHMDLDIDIQGRHVLIVEDIVDTGQTIEHLLAHLARRRPASLGVCTLLVREGVHRVLEYAGFEVGEGFVIGMGIDLNQRFRQLPLIAQVAPAETESK